MLLSKDILSKKHTLQNNIKVLSKQLYQFFYNCGHEKKRKLCVVITVRNLSNTLKEFLKNKCYKKISITREEYSSCYESTMCFYKYARISKTGFPGYRM